MGEAKRRKEAFFEAYATGGSFPRPDNCPACSSKRIKIVAGPELWIEHAKTPDVGMCLNCRAVWEPFPERYVPDPVAAEPCDNCAFRPGSSEQKDKAEWRKLINSLKPSADEPWTSGRFYCHKHVPVDMTKGPGNFLFPEKKLDVDKALGTQTRAIIGTHDTSKMRVCSGFLRMVWSITGVKRPAP